MRHIRHYLLLSLIACVQFLSAQPAQPVAVDRFDYGKMWTFEHAPVEYFANTYGFRPDEAWLQKVRLSALRFASYCSASFISPDGLILTNHHCSEGEAPKVMQEGEDFDETGFYAATRAEERQVPGLFVKQLVRIADITDDVKALTDQATADEQISGLRDSAFALVLEEYGNKTDWQGLELETVTYYSGGKYSLYGYKRYDDIRLVLIPEAQLGFYGGDPDNFTYPRYSLDFTLWRAYEDGEPVNSSDFYFPVEPEGALENELVFAISNPGNTERYRTMAQLAYDRDYRYPTLLTWLSNRMEILKKQNAVLDDEQLESTIFSLSNSVKAYGGILEGLHNPELMARKQAMEDYVRSQSKAVAKGNNYWTQLAEVYEPLGKYAVRNTLLGPSGLGGNALLTAHYYANYVDAVEREAPAEDVEALKGQVLQLAASLDQPLEQEYLTLLLTELQTLVGEGEAFVRETLDGKSPEEAARRILSKTKFTDSEKLEKMLDGKAKKLRNAKDPLAELSAVLIPEYRNSLTALRASSARRRALEQAISNEVFQIYGLDIPPDATFTLRLADGLVKGYDYNGTRAPYKTTYFGLYDRFYANNGEFPWSLPERWQQPVPELLRSPLNFVATTDSTGGSSGSPIINQQGQLIGLLFDGNIESLSGNFIYDTEYNRSVAVHAGGLTAAMKYIYNAQRILRELGVE